MDIDKLKERLAGLLAKTKANGATEAEALAAFGMASDLADKYGVSLKDLQADSGAAQQMTRYDGEFVAGLHPVDLHLGVAIGKFCSVKVWRATENGRQRLTFFGYESDVELASYLRATLHAAFDREFRVYATYVYEGRNPASMRNSFAAGFAARLAERMSFLTKTKADSAGSDHNALIVLKTDAISAALAKQGIHLAASRARGQRLDPGAFGAGKVAGANTDIGRGVGQRRVAIGVSR